MNKLFSPGSFTIGLMVGLVIAGAWLLDYKDLNVQLDKPGIKTSSSERQSPASGAISVSDQPAGSEVIVESLTVPPPGVWVAVRETVSGSLGNVLGAARVSGPRSTVIVTLLRNTEPARSYAVELYRDDYESSFDVSRNSVFIDFDTGEPVIAYFKTTE